MKRKEKKKVVHNLLVQYPAGMNAAHSMSTVSKHAGRSMQFGTNLQRAASCLARHTWTYGASVSHAHTPTTHSRLNRKATYDRCRMNHHRTSWCSRRWSPPTAGDTPPDGSMTPPYRWYWVLWAPPQRKIIFVRIFWLIIHSFVLFVWLTQPKFSV